MTKVMPQIIGVRKKADFQKGVCEAADSQKRIPEAKSSGTCVLTHVGSKSKPRLSLNYEMYCVISMARNSCQRFVSSKKYN